MLIIVSMDSIKHIEDEYQFYLRLTKYFKNIYYFQRNLSVFFCIQIAYLRLTLNDKISRNSYMYEIEYKTKLCKINSCVRPSL